MGSRQQPQQQHHWGSSPHNEASPIKDSFEFDLPPQPPAHRQSVGLHLENQSNQAHSQRHHQDPNNYADLSTPIATPPASDNLSKRAAGGGIDAIAAEVANVHERESGMHAARAVDGWGRNSDGYVHSHVGPSRPMGVPDPNATPFHDQYAYEPPIQRAMYSQRNYDSNPALAGPSGVYHSNRSTHSMSSPIPPQGHPYSDTPYQQYSSSAQNLAPQLGVIDPNEVADDDDWGMGNSTAQHPKRRSFAAFGTSRSGSHNGSPGTSTHNGVAAGGLGAATGGAVYAASGDGSGNYNSVPAATISRELLGEKSWKVEDDLKVRKRRMWIAIVIITLIMIGAILGGVLGAFIGKGKPKSATGQSASDVAADNQNQLDANSKEIKALMNNPILHKVFPGMDYTPLNAQYPDCLTVGPSQNNVTRDLAVMSQLTNTVRTYGTDCGQTQMLIESIKRLQLKDMKVWMGVWLDNNITTTQRQIDQAWKILDDYGCDYFRGVIIGNEVLFRKDLTPSQLIQHVTDFKQNISDHKCQLPVGMADLGDNWTTDMATQVDVVMSNIHPFFAGVDAAVAAGWTWNFWQNNDVPKSASKPSIKQVIAEVGWPTAGGKSCGSAPTCSSSTPGSVAGIDELNRFMNDWVCPSLQNGTNYFWFSAFDEPWKIRYNEPGKNWEDKWGIMDVNRNLKPGVKIPSCSGLSLPS